jgi:hypothetical protein
MLSILLHLQVMDAEWAASTTDARLAHLEKFGYSFLFDLEACAGLTEAAVSRFVTRSRTARSSLARRGRLPHHGRERLRTAQGARSANHQPRAIHKPSGYGSCRVLDLHRALPVTIQQLCPDEIKRFRGPTPMR